MLHKHGHVGNPNQANTMIIVMRGYLLIQAALQIARDMKPKIEYPMVCIKIVKFEYPFTDTMPKQIISPILQLFELLDIAIQVASKAQRC